MFKFIDISSQNKNILDQEILKFEQAGSADEPRDTIEVAKNYTMAKPIAIYNDEDLIAFLVYEALNPGKSDFLIWDFVVHHKFQRKGFGYKIMKQLITLLKSKYKAKRIELAFVPDNLPAKNLYLKLGFKENGEINSDGEVIMGIMI